jgi:hypothetical protein
MTSSIRMNTTRPTPTEIEDLKRLAAGIIRAQGNRFVKTLLRSKDIQVGANKDEFQANLTAAIESGDLTLADVRTWLASVEGWGNQHVYVYNISSTLRRELTEPKIRQRVSKAKLDSFWNGETALAFPDEPQLTSISFNDSVLRLVWQEASPDWAPAPERNFQKEEGLDLYEYRAFRKVEWRAITRFEAHMKDGIAGLFIADPIQGPEHQAAIQEAKRVLRLLMDVDALDRGQMDIAVISRNLDQQNVPNNRMTSPQVKAQKSRLTSGGASVEFAANSTDKAYWEEPAIQDVRNSVRPQQLRSFQGADGVFIFQKNSLGLTRPLRVQLYGKERRVRLRAQMEVAEVWAILTKLSTQQ